MKQYKIIYEENGIEYEEFFNTKNELDNFVLDLEDRNIKYWAFWLNENSGQYIEYGTIF